MSEYIINVHAGEDLDPISLLPKTFHWNQLTDSDMTFEVIPEYSFAGYSVGDKIYSQSDIVRTIVCFIEIPVDHHWYTNHGPIAAGFDNHGLGGIQTLTHIAS